MISMLRHPLKKRREAEEPTDRRLLCLKIGVGLFILLALARLFFLQIVNHQYYLALAEGRHSLYRELLPSRGRLFLQNLKKGEELTPLAVNRDVFSVVADPKLVDEPAKAARILAQKLGLDELEVKARVIKTGSQYEIIKKQVSAETVDELKLEKLVGVSFERQPYRFYPEKEIGSQLAGYYGVDKDGQPEGFYGLEGYFDELLTGKPGYFSGEQDAAGAWLPLAKRESQEPVDGADLVLTVEQTIEYVACEKLKKGVEEYKAKGGAVIIINPKTGAILAMCNWPAFDPNNYNQVKDIRFFNNQAIFTPYEPGSVFKAMTMAGALDAGKVLPDTKYIDKGAVKIGDRVIKNAAEKVYGEQTMTGVLKESINTGAVFASQQLGQELFRKYVKDFGFGVLSGVELDTEAPGNISSLEKRGEIYIATASFGQGIAVTPLQLVMAFGAIANNGKLYKPRIISEIRYPDGRIEKREPQFVRQVISPRTARLLSAMLTTVVREGHGKSAQVEGYYIAGKTGTAQIPGPEGGYVEGATEQTFIGFGPVDDPVFVMLVKYDEPERLFAEYTAVPTFGEIAKFLLQYLEVPPSE